MNKQEFLRQLEERLQMLNASEREDILSEYAQHIDMKMRDGLSEEQAIRDFGAPDDLIAEILEAYHFNPKYAGGESKLKKEMSGIASEAKKVSRGAFSWLKGILQGCSKMAEGIIEAALRLPGRMVARLRGNASDRAEKAAAASKTGGFLKNLFMPVIGMAGAVLRCCMYIAVLCAVALVLVPLVLLGLLALFGVGACAVLLMGGYPTGGPLLVCIGGSLCCGAAAVFLVSLLMRGATKPAAQGQEPPQPQGQPYREAQQPPQPPHDPPQQQEPQPLQDLPHPQETPQLPQDPSQRDL